jgi:hypothetical protein
MSNEEDKFRNSRRRFADEVKIQKQVQLARNYSYHKLSSSMHDWKYLTQPHRNHKKHIFNCGDSHCYMCGNPRKWDKEETIQERKHKQEKFYKDSNE